MTHSRPQIHELLDRYGLSARREFGQNFVADPNTVRRIAALSQVGPGDLVVEIGPGLGSLTLALIETGAEVIAVEVDPGMAAAAREVVGTNARIVEADALEVDWGELLDGHASAHVVANLPYNVGTTMILDESAAMASSSEETSSEDSISPAAVSTPSAESAALSTKKGTASAATRNASTTRQRSFTLGVFRTPVPLLANVDVRRKGLAPTRDQIR